MNVIDSGVPIDELIAAIKNAIRRANISNTDTDRDLRVVSIYLRLNTIATMSSGGRLEFRVPVLGLQVKFGGAVTRQDTHAVELTLVPDDDHINHEIRDGTIDYMLFEAIETLRTVVAKAGKGDDPFTLQTSSVELSFAVSQNGTLSLGIEGELKDEITHTLRLGLAGPTPVEAQSSN